MDDLARIAGALSDRTRVRLLGACFGGELCVCQLDELVGLSNATVSKHLSLLRDAGLLTSRKEGRWMYYRLAPPADCGPLLAGVQEACAKSDPFKEVVDALTQISGIEPEVLCRMQRGVECCPD